MHKVYLDNAATSFPKAPGVPEAMLRYMQDVGVNVGRGSYQTAYNAEETVLETREHIARLFSFPKPQNVVFTANVTYALNILLKGLLKPGDHCLVSSLEHNAVMRPLGQLVAQGVQFDRIPCDREGVLDCSELENMVRPNTKAVVMTHASNVSGTLLPVKTIGQLCQQKGLYFILDAAQSAGVIDIDFQALGLSALAFTGHKSLLGPQGIGGFMVTDELLSNLTPLITGGTGSLSDSEDIPPFMPDRLEPGTLNLPGIFGLSAALNYITEVGIHNIYRHEMSLTDMFLQGVSSLEGLRVVGLPGIAGRTSVVSLDFLARDNASVTHLLDTEHQIMTRCGLHCSPAAHRALGSFPQGTVRFSFGAFNNEEDVTKALSAIKKILKN